MPKNTLGLKLFKLANPKSAYPALRVPCHRSNNEDSCPRFHLLLRLWCRCFGMPITSVLWALSHLWIVEGVWRETNETQTLLKEEEADLPYAWPPPSG